MKEMVLYRKYRSQNFSEVLGQDHIISVLENALKRNSFSHAYLFYGSRGTGKTSVARIFAKELGIASSDVYEIDAASNRGIDDIRALREGVNTSPFESKYKIYIIDEVHMLTKEAFNALLKTLEEPPAHVIFVLATTEIEKVPETIVSRCETYTFRKPTEEILKKYVLNILGKEGFQIEEELADLIALLSDGSFRDACGIMQKLLSFSKDKKIEREEVEKITGVPGKILINDFILSLLKKDIASGMKVIEKITSQSLDVKFFVKLLLHNLRFFLILRYAPSEAKNFKHHVSESDFKFLEELAKDKSNIFNSQSLIILLECYDNINLAFIPTLPLELALIKIAGEGK